MLLLLCLVYRFACFALLRVSRLSVRVGLLSAHLLSKKLSPRRDGLTCQTTRSAQDAGAHPKPASARGDAPARREGWGVSAVRHQQRPGAVRAAKKAGPPATRTTRTATRLGTHAACFRGAFGALLGRIRGAFGAQSGRIRGASARTRGALPRAHSARLPASGPRAHPARSTSVLAHATS